MTKKNIFEEADTQVKICNAAEAVVSSLIVLSDQRKAIKFLGPNLVVKLTRQRKVDRRARQHTFLLTVGKPNYAERKFVKECKKAGEPFPVEKVQLQGHPVKRKLKTQSKGKAKKAA